MSNTDSDTSDLLRRVTVGDRTAINQLLDRHRGRLKGMVSMRMDRRIRARVDPSDVVQEALMNAAKHLPRYAHERPIPFYPWLRNIAWEQLIKIQKRHVDASKRSVALEKQSPPNVSDESIQQLAERLATSASGPVEKLVKSEMRRRTRAALQLISPRDRELLELRYLEQLDNAEIAAVLAISIAAVRTRHFRAIQRLHNLLCDDSLGSPS